MLLKENSNDRSTEKIKNYGKKFLHTLYYDKTIWTEKSYLCVYLSIEALSFLKPKKNGRCMYMYVYMFMPECNV